MMKRFLLTVMAAVLALGVLAQEGKFSLTGEVKGLGPMGYCILTDVWGDVIDQDLLRAAGGKVDMVFDLETMGYLMVVSNNRTITLPAIPGEAVTIAGDIDNYTVDGSALYKEYNEVLTATMLMRQACRKYDFKQACADEIMGLSSEAMFDLFQRKVRENSQPVTDAVLAHVAGHPDHESSMLLMTFLDYAEDIERAGDMMSEQVLDGRMRPYYESNLERVRHYGASNPLLGKPAPELKLADVDGKALALSSLHGKWLVIDLWLPSCSNAVSQFPTLKGAYAQYKDRVELLGVNIENDEAAWKKALLKHRLPWLNVMADSDVDDANNPLNLYKENGTPSYFLIAPSGKVAARCGSADEVMYYIKLLFE
ncbi:MAG: TlpA family protein disulfide reductase [Muribaculaceae bacterium]|nr:TlpA family protein disulfide reductase [Muribaculaceae bacterium]